MVWDTKNREESQPEGVSGLQRQLEGQQGGKFIGFGVFEGSRRLCVRCWRLARPVGRIFV